MLNGYVDSILRGIKSPYFRKAIQFDLILQERLYFMQFVQGIQRGELIDVDA